MNRLLSALLLVAVAAFAPAQIGTTWPITVVQVSESVYQDPGNLVAMSHTWSTSGASCRSGIDQALSGDTYTGGGFKRYCSGSASWSWAAYAPVSAPYTGLTVLVHVNCVASGQVELDVQHTLFFNQATVTAESKAEDSSGAVSVSDSSTLNNQSYADPSAFDVTIRVPFTVRVYAGVPCLEADFSYGSGTVQAIVSATIGGMTSPWSLTTSAMGLFDSDFTVTPTTGLGTGGV